MEIGIQYIHEDLVDTPHNKLKQKDMNKNPKELMKFIKRVKFSANMFTSFAGFYKFVHNEKRFNYQKVMVKSDFDRLVTVAGANLY